MLLPHHWEKSGLGQRVSASCINLKCHVNSDRLLDAKVKQFHVIEFERTWQHSKTSVRGGEIIQSISVCALNA